MPAVLAAKGIKADGPQQPFPPTPLLGRPNLCVPAPGALPLRDVYTSPDRVGPASLA
jgi:hypothetical protein